QPAAQATNTAASTAPITTVNSVKINGVEYHSLDAALAVRQAEHDKVVAQLPVESDPIKGRALVVLPDRDRMRPLMAQQENLAYKRVVTGQALDWFVSETEQNLQELADALVKNKTFERITVVQRNEVLNPPDEGADFVVWFQVRTALPNNSGP